MEVFVSVWGEKINKKEKDLAIFYDDPNHISYKLLKAYQSGSTQTRLHSKAGPVEQLCSYIFH